MIINLHFFGGGGGPSRYYEQNNPQNRRVRSFPTDGNMGIGGGWEATPPPGGWGPTPTPVDVQNRRVRSLPTDGSMGIGGWESTPTPVSGGGKPFENANRVPGGILDQLDISNPGWREEAEKNYIQLDPMERQVGISQPAGPNPRLGNPREAYQNILPVGNPTPLPQRNVYSIEPWQRRNPNDIVSNGKGGSQYPQPYNRIQDPYRRIAGNGK